VVLPVGEIGGAKKKPGGVGRGVLDDSGIIADDHADRVNRLGVRTLTTNASITLSFTNLPATNSVGRFILDVNVVNTSHTITIPTAVLVSGNVSGGDGSSNTITVPTSGRYLYEFLTPDNGTTILMHQLGNNYI